VATTTNPSDTQNAMKTMRPAPRITRVRASRRVNTTASMRFLAIDASQHLLEYQDVKTS
jgi:hypothetical protein